MKRWTNTISWQDLISLNLTPVDVEDQDDWRRRTRVADPSPELGIHSLNERERERETDRQTDRQTDSDLVLNLTQPPLHTVAGRDRSVVVGIDQGLIYNAYLRQHSRPSTASL